MAKDLFSEQASVYAKYRPTYPEELFEYILKFVRQRDRAWDCATGNGQAAIRLAEYFIHVDASDISQSQVSNAAQRDNISYHICPAEQTPFPENSFDLITVAQAYHWFHWEEFHEEVTRVGKPGAVIAVWAYNLFISDDERINQLIKHFYNHIGPFWDDARKYVDEGYATTVFDFEPLPSKDFVIQVKWTREQLTGYLKSWSAVQTYLRQKNESPLDSITSDLEKLWGDETAKTFRFPVFLRIGRINKS